MTALELHGTKSIQRVAVMSYAAFVLSLFGIQGPRAGSATAQSESGALLEYSSTARLCQSQHGLAFSIDMSTIANRCDARAESFSVQSCCILE